jgi:iron(III) transport system substrate-binding protein
MLRILSIAAALLLCSATALARETLHLVTSLDPLEAAEYIQVFEKDTGIGVEWIRLSAGEVLARIKAEGPNQTQTVWFGGGMPDFVAAKEAGALTPYLSPEARALKNKWNDAEGYYTNIYIGLIAFISNKNYLNGNGLSPPETWQDLLASQWRGRIAISYPYTAGTGYTILAGTIALMGEDGAYEYWKRLDPSIHHYTKSGAAPIIEVGLGEASVGVVFAQDAVRKGVARGFPLVVTYPKEGTSYEIGSVALIKNGPEIELGKKFIDWISSLKGQDLFYKYGRTPLHPKARLPEDVGGKAVKVLDINPIEMGELKHKYVERWRKELRQ